MSIKLKSRLTVALSIIVLGVGGVAYYWLTNDSRAIAYHKARLQPSADNSNRRADQDALIKLGWLVHGGVHFTNRVIKTNAATEFYQAARQTGVQLKEPVFFSILRPDPEKPADIVFTAYREDVPTVQRVLAQLDSPARE